MDAPELVSWDEVRPRLAQVRRLAFDLEGDFNLHRYGRRICLFQVALEDGSAYLLDPLDDGRPATPAWEGWREVLENPEVTKVIWAAQNDIRVLKHCHGVHLRGLWDLFDAACLVAGPRPSLPGLVRTFLNMELEKAGALQTSDWSRRPLSPAQRGYAVLDVVHLLALADRLAPLLTAKGQDAVFRDRMKKAEAYVFRDEPEPWRKLRGAALLSPAQTPRLQQIWEERERLARLTDLAPWKVAEPDELVFWAREGRFEDPVTELRFH